MTTKEMSALVGKQALYSLASIKVLVCIKDVRQAYGRVDYQVEPVGGQGLVWVQSSSVSLI